MEEIFFSVVIPSYNRVEHLPVVIRSFLEQEYPLFEVIVVDDGSKDNSKEVVASFKDERIHYYYKENGERGAARNYGAARAKGTYVTFFDSDDIVYPWYLSNAAKQLSAINKPECYAQAFEFRNVMPQSFPPRPDSNSEPIMINRKLIKENFLACNGVFVRQDILKTYGFSEQRELSGSEDWVLWLQLAANYSFHFSPVVCSCLVNHSGRGEMNVHPEKMKVRLKLLIEKMQNDEEIGKFGRLEKQQLLSSGYLFAATKLADFRIYKLSAIYRLLKSMQYRLSVMGRHNFYVTIRKILFSWH